LQATAGSEAAGRVDLLTVVTHEFGHLLGLPDLPTAVFPRHIMNETIGLGTRRTPDSLSHRIDPHNPVSQPPHVYFGTIRAGLLAGTPSDKREPILDALDQVLAEEEIEWDAAVDALFAKENSLDRVLRDWEHSNGPA